jgi:hypothetical protein
MLYLTGSAWAAGVVISVALVFRVVVYRVLPLLVTIDDLKWRAIEYLRQFAAHVTLFLALVPNVAMYFLHDAYLQTARITREDMDTLTRTALWFAGAITAVSILLNLPPCGRACRSIRSWFIRDDEEDTVAVTAVPVKAVAWRSSSGHWMRPTGATHLTVTTDPVAAAEASKRRASSFYMNLWPFMIVLAAASVVDVQLLRGVTLPSSAPLWTYELAVFVALGAPILFAKCTLLWSAHKADATLKTDPLMLAIHARSPGFLLEQTAEDVFVLWPMFYTEVLCSTIVLTVDEYEIVQRSTWMGLATALYGSLAMAILISFAFNVFSFLTAPAEG